MTTTFQDPELVRDELVALFIADGSWQQVYGYMPAGSELVGLSRFLVIRRRGTLQQSSGQWTNPVDYRFAITSFVLAYSDIDSWTSAQAEDKLDELDQKIRQIIRTNMGDFTNCDIIAIEDSFSEVRDITIENKPYIAEARFVIAKLVNGAV
jgi:hypothetical protein